MALGKGTALKISDMGGSPVFTAIAHCTTTTTSTRTTATESTTSNDSGTPVTTLLPTVYTNGKISVVVSPWDPNNTQHAQVEALSTSLAANDFQIVYSDGVTTQNFSGFVTSFQLDATPTSILKAKFDVTPTGAFS